jgi:hypothetical protein
MPIYDDFSGRHRNLPVTEIATPVSLQDLRQVVVRATAEGRKVHAMGARWAFSAPAYCSDILVDMAALRGFPEWLTAAIIEPVRGRERLIAVEAGIQIRALTTVLQAGAVETQRLTPPTLGGAGGQSLSGAINTGTHGGDVARPPLGDYVRAVILVGTGGVVRVIQRPGHRVLDVDRLRPALAREAGADAVIIDDDSPDALDAAVLGLGRLGIAYAYVYVVHDEHDTFIYENRKVTRWSALRDDLRDGGTVRAARAGDEFLQYVVDPIADLSGDRLCYQTVQKKLPKDRVPDAGLDFGLGDVPSTPVEQARDKPMPAQTWCADSISVELRVLQVGLNALGILVAAHAFPFTLPAALPFFAAARSIERIGPDHRLGDVLAEALNLASPAVLELLNRAVLMIAQSDRLPRPLLHHDRGPYLAHGTRPLIADIYDYVNSCYRADSIELFFAADEHLPDRMEAVFEVFESMRREGTPIGAYISMRFLSASSALLATATHPVTCAVEVSMLRGLDGNTEAQARLQRVAVEHHGLVHWGQWNELDAVTVRAMFGDRLDRWLTKLRDFEGESTTFSNPFSRRHGLELQGVADWAGWVDTATTTARAPAVLSAGRGQPLEVFAVNGAGQVAASRRPADRPAESWRVVRTEAIGDRAAPVVIRSVDGRVELFVRGADDRLQHCWEEGRPGAPFSGWNTKSEFPWPGRRITADPAVAAHSDGRLEVFALELLSDGSRMLKACADVVNGIWGGFGPMNDEKVGSAASACLRRRTGGGTATDQLIVAAVKDGVIAWIGQHGPGGGSGWGAWQQIGDGLRPGGTAPPLIAEIVGPHGRPHVWAVDALGQVQEAVEESDTVGIRWSGWRPLPVLAVDDQLDADAGLAFAQAGSGWLFGRALRGHVMAIETAPGAGWGSWTNLGGAGTDRLAVGACEDGRIDVFMRGRDNRLMARRQAVPGRW